ncbi:hypothetical protein [Paraburkholderia caffeinilytica]|uniref:hypothetical protein n=1 Tax=Paraburkholderia caffeinilytica TaxID=1761016 RepID=UPI003DA0F130
MNAYNRFQLPRYRGDPMHPAADSTQWNLYENNLLSENGTSATAVTVASPITT